jgi:hypothetical protein
MQYTIQVAWSKEFNQFCLLIIDDDTGEYLSLPEYENWIQIIGGFNKRRMY